LTSARGIAIVIGLRLLRAVMDRGGLKIIGVVWLAEVPAARPRVALAAPASGSALSHAAAVLRQVRQSRLDPLPLTRRSPFE
jgi:hypothetical protein